MVSNLYVEAFEERVLCSSTTCNNPKLWLRYVDDAFVLLAHGLSTLEEFHSHLNTQHPSIPFTRVEESKGKIPILDIMVQKKGASVKTTVYRKPTNTDTYVRALHFSSPL